MYSILIHWIFIGWIQILRQIVLQSVDQSVTSQLPDKYVEIVFENK